MTAILRSQSDRKFNRNRLFTTAICSMAFCLTGAGGYVQIASEELFSTMGSNGKPVVCAIINGKALAGKVNSRGFLSQNAVISALKTKLKSLTGSKKIAMKKKVANAIKKSKADNKLCLQAHNGQPPPPPTQTPGSRISTPTPLPQSTPTPRPQPTSTPSSGGNVGAGQSLFSNYCQGCHSPRSLSRRSAAQLSASASRPEMAGVRSILLNSTNVANLAAYLATQ